MIWINVFRGRGGEPSDPLNPALGFLLFRVVYANRGSRNIRNAAWVVNNIKSVEVKFHIKMVTV